MQPYMVNTFTKSTKNDGLGGARSLRGILRNRIVGDAFGYGNFELRYKFLKFHKWNQNFYLSLNGFTDMGMITKTIDLDLTKIPEGEEIGLFNPSVDQSLHVSYGAGLRIAMNQNFIVAVDYGIAGDKRDGTKGMYINLGFLF
jgi:hemolysin activation/secretion protein